MPCLHIPIPKKLKQLPSSSRKAWQSFTSSIRPRLCYLRDHLEIPTSVTTAARRLLHLRPKRGPRTGRAEGRLSYYRSRQQHYQYRYLQQCSSVPASPATVHVDRLFGESSKTQTTGLTSTGAGEQDSGPSNEDHRNQETEQRRRRSRAKAGDMETKDVKWKEYASSLPTIRGVDERAEEFISKFRQEMQLEREQSILEFQKMLTRSA
uniref:Uncharacterized protein n=1 Tax=Opuntia streptacantha TaxID=393608 RepID=A0A7C9DLE7_OPUST